MQPEDSYQNIFAEVNRILVVLSHPDDAEVICGGLIARLTKDNKVVRLVITTNGGKGMQDKKGLNEDEFGNERIQEQIRAGKILGVNSDENFNLNFPDGEFENDLIHIERIVWHIREFKPDLVITHNPTEDVINFNNSSHWVNHRDHRKTAQAAIDACYPYSRDRGFFTDHFDKGLESHKVTKLLLADSYLHPDVKHFDTTEYIESKKQALQSHPSAINPDYADEYIEENKIGDRYFEPLRYVEVY